MGNSNSFLPEDYLDRKIARRTNLICVGLFVVMIVAIGAAFYVQSRQDAGTTAQRTAVNQEFTKRAAQLRQIQELQDRQKQMIEKADVIRELVERVPRSIILAEMVNEMPRSLSLTQFKLETKTVAKPRDLTSLQRDKSKRKKKKDKEEGKFEKVDRAVSMWVEGLAENENQITKFMGNLTHHPLFKDVQLTFIQKTTVEKVNLRHFAIVMTLNQDVLIERSAPDQLKRDLVQDPLGDDIQINADGKTSPPKRSLANTESDTD